MPPPARSGSKLLRDLMRRQSRLKPPSPLWSHVEIETGLKTHSESLGDLRIQIDEEKPPILMVEDQVPIREERTHLSARSFGLVPRRAFHDYLGHESLRTPGDLLRSRKLVVVALEDHQEQPFCRECKEGIVCRSTKVLQGEQAAHA